MRLAASLLELASDLGARDIRQGNIHQDDVRLEIQCKLDSLVTIAGFSHDREVWLDFRSMRSPAADDGVIIDKRIRVCSPLFFLDTAYPYIYSDAASWL